MTEATKRAVAQCERWLSASGGSVGERAGARFIGKSPKREQRASGGSKRAVAQSERWLKASGGSERAVAQQRASGGSKRAVAQSERWLRASGGSGRAVARNGGFRSHCGEGGSE